MKLMRTVQAFLVLLAGRVVQWGRSLLAIGRVLLGMIAFLAGLLTCAAGAVAVPVGVAYEVGLLPNAPTSVEFVGALARGAWIGALVFVAGIALLWVSRALDDRGPVRSYTSPRKRVKAARHPAR